MFVNIEMGSFDVLKDLFVEIANIAGDNLAVYGIFIIAGSILLYQFLNHVAFQKVMKGKAGNAVSGLLTLIIIGGMFYGKTVDDVMTNVGDFVSFIISLALAGLVFYMAIRSYLKRNEDGNPHVSKIFMFLGLIFSSTIFIQIFSDKSFLQTSMGINLEALSGIFAFLLVVSLFGVFVEILLFLSSVFKGGAKKSFDVWESRGGGKVNRQNIKLLKDFETDLKDAISDAEKNMKVLEKNMLTK